METEKDKDARKYMEREREDFDQIGFCRREGK